MTKKQVLNFFKAPFSKSFVVAFAFSFFSLLAVPLVSAALSTFLDEIEEIYALSDEDAAKLFFTSLMERVDAYDVTIAVIGVIVAYFLFSLYYFLLVHKTVEENKGIFDVLDRRVNEEMNNLDRPVPFTNIIYIGDSETDIPSMRLVYTKGGTSIGLYQKGTRNEHYLKDLLVRDRISYVASADYTEQGELDGIIKELIKKIKHDNIANNLRLAQIEDAKKSE